MKLQHSVVALYTFERRRVLLDSFRHPDHLVHTIINNVDTAYQEKRFNDQPILFQVLTSQQIPQLFSAAKRLYVSIAT